MKKNIFLFLFYLMPVCLAAQTASWQPSGPSQLPLGNSPNINCMGRISQVIFHPADSQQMFIVASNGGLWKSTNSGLQWNVTGTDNLPMTSTSCFAIDRVNPMIMYLATGDNNYGMISLGIWKSADGGQTWNPAGNPLDTLITFKMLADSAGSGTLLACTNYGVWRTADGGNTWTNTLPVAATCYDMQRKPGISDTVYAVTQQAFYRSPDGGITWAQTLSPLTSSTGFQPGVRIAVTPADPDVIYVGMVIDQGTMLRSADAGDSFTVVYTNPTGQSLTGYNSSGYGQGNYNFCIAADPDSANVVYMGSQNMWKSTDNGYTWHILNVNWWDKLHTDMHDLQFSPYHHSELYCTSDGGVWLSTDGGNNWTPRVDGLQVTEIYHCAQSPVLRDLFQIGTQDNGGEHMINNIWYGDLGGDVYSTMKFGYEPAERVYFPSGSHSYGWISGTAYWWSCPVPGGIITAVSPTEMDFNPAAPDTAVLFNQWQYDIWRTFDVTDTIPQWTSIGNTDSVLIMALDYNHADTTMYVLLGNGNMMRYFHVMDLNPVYDTVITPLTSYNRSALLALKQKPGVIYLADINTIYRSDDYGITWTDITSNLAGMNSYFIRLIEDEHTSDESVYISTYDGVYYRNNTMGSWLLYTQGLPTIAGIRDMDIYNDGTPQSLLRVATWGRGVWETPLVSHPAGLPEKTNEDDLRISPNPGTGLFRITSSHIKKGELFLYNNMGMEIKRTNCSFINGSCLLHAENLANGMYLLKLSGDDNILYTRKLLVVH